MFEYIAKSLGALIVNSFFIGFRILDFFIFSRPGYKAKMYCSQGNFTACKELLDTSQIDVNHKDSSGQSLLHLAMQGGNKELVEYLVAKGADLNAKDKSGNTILHSAAIEGNHEMIKFLLDLGVDIKAKDNKGNTVLHVASCCCTIKTIFFLIKEGAKLTELNKFGATSVHIAALTGATSNLEALIKKYPKMLEQTSQSLTPLYCAAEKGHDKTVIKLLKLGAKCDTTDPTGKILFARAGISFENNLSAWDIVFTSKPAPVIAGIKTMIALINYGTYLIENNLDTLIKKNIKDNLVNSAEPVSVVDLLMPHRKLHMAIDEIPLEDKLLALKIIQINMDKSIDPTHNDTAELINEFFNTHGNSYIKIFCNKAQEHIKDKKTYLINIDTERKLHKFFPEHQELTMLTTHLNKCAATTVSKFFSHPLLLSHLDQDLLNKLKAVIKDGLAQENITKYLDLDSLSATFSVTPRDTPCYTEKIGDNENEIKKLKHII